MKFDPRILHKYCTSTIDDIWHMNGAQITAGFNGGHGFIDRGGDILAVAHLDIAMHVERWQYRFKITKNNTVYSVALDDRLGAYLICDYLPRLGLNFDVLLTENEEIGSSTAADFIAKKNYNWIFEFDRRGNDVVLYEYDDPDLEALLVKHGFRVGTGSFSDICYLENLGVKAMNFGTGYFSEHTMSCHANLKITARQVDRFAAFFRANQYTKLEHTPLAYAYSAYLPYGSKRGKYGGKHSAYHGYDNAWDDEWYLDRTSETKSGKKQEHWKRRDGTAGKTTVITPAKKAKSDRQFTDQYGNIHKSSQADQDNHDPNSILTPDNTLVTPDNYDPKSGRDIEKRLNADRKDRNLPALPFSASIHEIDPIELDWNYIAPLYESARMRIHDLYGIDIDDLSWHDYCGILGISPTATHSWSDSDWIIWNIIGDGGEIDGGAIETIENTPW